jgi:L-amino acid N-acyltransferase YncA
MKNEAIFRDIKEEDISQVLNIYNYYITNDLANFEELPFTKDQFFKLYDKIIQTKLPFIVCEISKIIVGFAYLNNFRNKSGYKFSYENSIYIDVNFIGKGLGSKLLKKLLDKSYKIQNVKTIISVIGGDNTGASIKIHEKNGFKLIGTLKKVGFKKNQWLDSIYMQKIINEKD